MTLEDAKKEIKRRADAYYNCYKGWDKEKPEMRGSLNFLYSSNGLDEALEILDKVEPSGNPEQLTLEELAQELRKVFRFKYLTVSPDFCGCPMGIYCWTSIRPTYNTKGRMWIISQEGSQTIASSFEAWHLKRASTSPNTRTLTATSTTASA